jgi:hypothetical protein
MSTLLTGLFAEETKTFPEKVSPVSPVPPKGPENGDTGETGETISQKVLKSERPVSTPIERSNVSNIPEVSNAPEVSVSIPALPVNLGRIADAIAANPRSPILGDLALAVFARHAVEAQRAIEHLPTAAKVEALARCREVENQIVGAINGLNYQSAYNIAATLARLPDELNRFALQ